MFGCSRRLLVTFDAFEYIHFTVKLPNNLESPVVIIYIFCNLQRIKIPIFDNNKIYASSAKIWLWNIVKTYMKMNVGMNSKLL